MRTMGCRTDVDEILRRMGALRPRQAPQWGRMSAHQMVCHLSDGLRMMLGEKPVRRITGAFEAALARWIALYAPRRWPPGIRTTPELDQEVDGTRPVDFTTDLTRLEDLVNRVARAPRAVDHRLHPIFGRMSGRAWLRWGYLHADHHLRQFGA